MIEKHKSKKSKGKVHYPVNWGMTACGLDGWGHTWSSWDAEDALRNSLNKRCVTCKNCRATWIRPKRKK